MRVRDLSLLPSLIVYGDPRTIVSYPKTVNHRRDMNVSLRKYEWHIFSHLAKVFYWMLCYMRL